MPEKMMITVVVWVGGKFQGGSSCLTFNKMISKTSG